MIKYSSYAKAGSTKKGNFHVSFSLLNVHCCVLSFHAQAPRVIKHYYALLFIWKSDTANHNNSINKVLSSEVRGLFYKHMLHKHTRHSRIA